MIPEMTPADRESTHGRAIESSFLKEKMRTSAEKCGSGLLRFYNVAGNGSQENKMRYMLKELMYSKNDDDEYICETIYEEANTHLASAMKYGYTAEDLASLRNSLNEYRALVKNKRPVIGNKKKLEDILQSFPLPR